MLKTRLDDPSNQVRFSTAAALAEMDERAGVDFLFDAMRDPDPILRTNAVKFLSGVQKNTGTVQAQLIALSSREASREQAAQIPDRRVLGAAEALQAATGDNDAQVRANAVIALGHIGLPESRMPLEALLSDPIHCSALCRMGTSPTNSTEKDRANMGFKTHIIRLSVTLLLASNLISEAAETPETISYGRFSALIFPATDAVMQSSSYPLMTNTLQPTAATTVPTHASGKYALRVVLPLRPAWNATFKPIATIRNEPCLESRFVVT